MKRLLLIFFTFLILCGTSNAEYFSDIIVTSPNGIWTDSRTYSTLNDAVAAVGANKRTIVIANQQVVTSLTVPSNVTLKFERDGSIANSGQLTINTKDIISDNHQIFTGAGNIDFASGSIIKSSWFSNVESAFALTNNDTLTLIISKPQIITASYSPGNNVHLQWEAPGNILTVSAGVTVGNLGKITAGDYQILAGAGDVDFVDGIRLKSCWFDSLRTITTWIESEKVSLAIIGEELVDFDITIQRNIMVDFDSNHGSISISAGVTLYVYQDSLISTIQDPIFTGLGTVAYIYNIQYYIDLAGTDKFTLKLRHIIGLANTDYILLENTTIPSNITLAFEPGARLSPAAGITVTVYSPENIAGGQRQQIITGSGILTFSTKGTYSVGWWNDIQKAITCAESVGGGRVVVPGGIWTTEGLVFTGNSTLSKIIFEGDGYSSRIVNTGATPSITVGSTGYSDSEGYAYLEIKNLWIEGSASSGHGIALLHAREVKIRDCYIYKHGGDGIYADDSWANIIEGNRIVDGDGDGINLASDGNSVRILNNAILSHNAAGKAGIRIDGCDAVTVLGNDIEGNTYGLYLPASEASNAINIISNNFEGNTIGIEAKTDTGTATIYSLNIIGNQFYQDPVNIGTTSNGGAILGGGFCQNQLTDATATIISHKVDTPTARNFAIFGNSLAGTSVLIVDGNSTKQSSIMASEYAPLYRFFTNFIANDTSPNVAHGDNHKTANTLATTIVGFDGGYIGQNIKVIVNDINTTVDFTGTRLKGNGGVDWVPATGDWMECVYDGTEWYCSVHDCTP